jgi:hypothetical protein
MRFTSPSTGLPRVCATRVDAQRPAGWLATLFAGRRAACVAAWSGLLFAPPAQALPIDFNDKVEAALLCRSDWSTAWWHDYFNTHLQASIRDWGEARWWDSQDARLGGANSIEMFANIDTSRALMVGTLIDQPVEEVKKVIEDTLKVQFKPVQTIYGLRYMTDTLSVLVGLDNQQTKWYCARWNMGNRERVKPMTPN